MVVMREEIMGVMAVVMCVMVTGCDASKDVVQPPIHTRDQGIAHVVSGPPRESLDVGVAEDASQDTAPSEVVSRPTSPGASTDMGQPPVQEGESPQKPRPRRRDPNVVNVNGVTCCDGGSPVHGLLSSGSAPAMKGEGVALTRKEKISSRVEAGVLEVKGGCDREEIGKQIKRRLAAIKNCHERALASGSRVQGSVTYSVVSDEHGRAKEVTSADDTLQNEELSTCGGNVLKRLRYDKSAQGGGCIIRQTLTFQVDDVSPRDAP